MRTPFVLLIASALVLSCKTGGAKADKQVTLNFESRSGSEATGTGTFKEVDGKVTFTANISKLIRGYMPSIYTRRQIAQLPMLLLQDHTGILPIKNTGNGVKDNITRVISEISPRMNLATERLLFQLMNGASDAATQRAISLAKV